jgi:uncharacterized protein YcgI (DUF1989 family)
VTTATTRVVDSFVIPKERGRAFEMRAGQLLKVTEIEGPQTLDFNAFVLPDFNERFSAGRTRFFTGIHPRRGDHLWSNPPHERPLFTIVEDTVGENDLLFPRCSRIVFEPFGLSDHRGCQDSLQEAIEPFGLTPDDVHDTFNGFMRTGVDASGGIYIDLPSAQKDDYMVLECLVDSLVALSSCPAGDVHATNGGVNKSLGIEILEPA